MKRLPLVVLAFALLVCPLSGWDPEGHQVVAAIAQARLTATTKAAVSALLGTSMESVADWADNYVHDHLETSRWHYVDIPLRADRYDPARDCQNVPGRGDCSVAALDRFITVLRDASRPAGERQMALKFIVHLVGDIHCPMHSVDDRDRGGNEVSLTLLGKRTSLHSVWDGALMRAEVLTVPALTQQCEKLGVEVEIGNPVRWAEEAHDVARDVAYRVPANHQIDQDYVNAVMRATRLQLLRAGVRLAFLLNRVLDPAYVPSAPTASQGRMGAPVHSTTSRTRRGRSLLT